MSGRIRRKVEMTNWVLYIQCTKCLSMKEYTHFYKTNGSSIWYRWVCKECCKVQRENDKENIHNKMKEYYLNHKEERRKYNKEYREKNKDKLKIYDNDKRSKKWYVKIHNKTISFVRKNKIKLTLCSICGSCNKIELHHPDYNKRYEVVVVCNSCHKEIHSWYIDCPSPINLLEYNQIKDVSKLL